MGQDAEQVEDSVTRIISRTISKIIARDNIYPERGSDGGPIWHRLQHEVLRTRCGMDLSTIDLPYWFMEDSRPDLSVRCGKCEEREAPVISNASTFFLKRLETEG